VAQIAAMEAGERLALTRHLRPRLVPGGELPVAAVAERIVQREAAALRELGRRLQARRGGLTRRDRSGRQGALGKNSTGRGSPQRQVTASGQLRFRKL
jgi:hypothetical protein